MDNQNQQGPQGAERSSIPVVNGEAKPSRGRIKKVFISLVALVLLAGLGSTGYLYSQENSDNKVLSTQLEEANSKLSSLQTEVNELTAKDSSEETSAVPDGFKEYSDAENKFSFYYPAEWKDFKPKVVPIKDYRTDAVFGPVFGPTLKYDSDGNWIVTKPNDSDYIKDSLYQIEVARKDRSVTVHDFTTGEGGCMNIQLVFAAVDKMVEIQGPQVCIGENGDNEETDKVPEQVEQIAFSVKFI